ncbi:MAG: excinuclease ABC subunit UvrC [Candidatus Uhrbacteria bacterium]|nr:excinuclease ABC subunit UvrC [Candidatus Uhrbacteria bacterium]
MISNSIKIKNGALPDHPGVYFYFDKDNQLLYVGKATSLKSRVGSYFSSKRLDPRIAEMVSHIVRIEYIETPSVLEALVLEANQIKAKKPKYNILQRDDKSYLYLCITNEDFPRPVFYRGHELERFGVKPFDKELSAEAKKKFLRIFGPYTSGVSLKRALELVRPMFPWSICQPGAKRACFDYQLKKCPGVCVGAISKRDYRHIIKQLIQFFDGKKSVVVREMTKEMNVASRDLRFEDAAILSKKIFALEHIRDVALLTKEDYALPVEKLSTDVIDLDGRIEAYDNSNISGASPVASMTVFLDGKPAKHLYRKFKIKTVVGANDVASMEEVIRRRLARLGTKGWERPEVMIIDGGEPQVNRVQEVLDELALDIPIIGIAKGFDRKQDRFVFDRTNKDLARAAVRGKEIFQRVRDEAHRFAITFHRKKRSEAFLSRKK